jgi:hypothetical protein
VIVTLLTYRRTALFLVGLVALCAVPADSTSVAKGRPAASWCGAGGVGDWLCQQQGAVFVNDQELPARGSMTVPSGAKVNTVSKGIARLLFPGEARCVVGRQPTELYTRTGGYGALYTQVSGSSACKTKGNRKRILCGDPLEACPRRMTLRGEALTVLSSTTFASISSSEAYTRSGRFEVCDGYGRFQIPDGEGGMEEVEGHPRPGSRWVVEFEEAFSKVEEPNARAWAVSGSIKTAEYRPARGSCRSQVVGF